MTSKIIKFNNQHPKKKLTQEQHPEDWMMISPTAFELASGIKVSEHELKGMREAIYEIYEKTK